jgi:hypothetical protein
MLRFNSFAHDPGVAELADAADSKSAGALLCVGSTPSSGTKFHLIGFAFLDFSSPHLVPVLLLVCKDGLTHKIPGVVHLAPVTASRRHKIE